MSTAFDFGFFGGDKRQIYMINSLLEKGYRVAVYHTAETIHDKRCTIASTLSELFDLCKILIGPIPISRDMVTITAVTPASDLTLAHAAYLLKKEHLLIAGTIPTSITELCASRNIGCIDLMKDEKVSILNAIATAEGAIMEAISCSDRNLHGSNCLVFGYGRCAKVLAQKLKALDAMVTVTARSAEALAYAEAAGMQTVHLSNIKCILPSYHFIFNSIPYPVLDQDLLELVDREVAIIDIASSPGGIDFSYCNRNKINAKLCLGLPGKVAPKTSADILVTEILALLKERSD